MTSRSRAVRALFLVAAAVLVLAGCTAVTTLVDTSQALRNAGYQSVNVGFHLGSADEVDVSVSVSAPAQPQDTADVAHVVWLHFRERFDTLHVTVHGSGRTSAFRGYTFDELVAMFGARNPAWNRTTVTSATTRLGELIIGAVVVAGALIAVVAVVATRRRRRGRGGGIPPYPGAGGAWQPQGAGAGPWRPAQGAGAGGAVGGAGGGWAPEPLYPPPPGPPGRPGEAPGVGDPPQWPPAPPPPAPDSD